MKLGHVQQVNWMNEELAVQLRGLDGKTAADKTPLTDRDKEVYTAGFTQAWGALSALLVLHGAITR